MDNLASALLEELNCNVIFKIGNIGINESVVVTWIIMAFLVLLCLFLTSNLKINNPSKKQVVAESIVSFFTNMFKGMLGENAVQYVPYMTTVIIYIGIANIIGLFGFKPPTKDLNVTAGLAIMSIILIEYSGIRQKGTIKWLKSFAEPMPLVAPINILEVFIRPLSLCMRLFGNVLGAFVIMELIKMVCGTILPIPFSLYFDIFDGLIQAYVFAFLTSLFIREATE